MEASFGAMSTNSPCPVCECVDPRGATAHAIAAALVADDLDRAIELGLLGHAPCVHCAPACAGLQQRAREARLRALAARERYRARQARLRLRAEALQAKRSVTAPAIAKTAVLPAAAAAALARAKAKAAGRCK
jgi:hypothetical protein